MRRALLAVMLAACGSDSDGKPGGAACDQSSDCAAGLQCITISDYDASTHACASGVKICTTLCHTACDMVPGATCGLTCGYADGVCIPPTP